MKKIHESTDRAIYRSGMRILLLLAGALAVVATLGYMWGAPSLGITIVILMSFVSLIVGLVDERLVLDFHNKRLRYESRIAFYLIAKIDDRFANVSSISVRDNTVDTSARGTIQAQSAWNIVLDYAGDNARGLLIGIFVNQADAFKEAEVLSQKMGVKVGSAH